MYHTTSTPRPLKVVLYGLDDYNVEDTRELLKGVQIEPEDIKKLANQEQ